MVIGMTIKQSAKAITLGAFLALFLVFTGYGAQQAWAEDNSSPFQSLMDEIDSLKRVNQTQLQKIEVQADQIKELMEAKEADRERIRLCTRESIFTLRLVCYDDVARDMNLISAQAAQSNKESIEKQGFWNITRRVNSLGENVTTLTVNSTEPVTSRTGARLQPTFNIRCRSQNTDVFLDWQSPLNAQRVYISEQEITYKIDDDPLYNALWELSQDNHAAFAKRPVEFVRNLRGKQQLVLMVTPHGGRSATMIFPLAGLDSALDVLVEHCYN